MLPELITHTFEGETFSIWDTSVLCVGDKRKWLTENKCREFLVHYETPHGRLAVYSDVSEAFMLYSAIPYLDYLCIVAKRGYKKKIETGDLPITLKDEE